MGIFELSVVLTIPIPIISYWKGRTLIGGWMAAVLISIASLEKFAMAGMESRFSNSIFILLPYLWILSLIMTLAMKSDRSVLDQRALKAGKALNCPSCSAVVVLDADFCPYCASPLMNKATRSNLK